MRGQGDLVMAVHGILQGACFQLCVEIDASSHHCCFQVCGVQRCTVHACTLCAGSVRNVGRLSLLAIQQLCWLWCAVQITLNLAAGASVHVHAFFDVLLCRAVMNSHIHGVMSV